jgi:hypothetical protein
MKLACNKAYSILDGSGSGHVGAQDLPAGFEMLGLHLRPEEAREMLAKCALNSLPACPPACLGGCQRCISQKCARSVRVVGQRPPSGHSGH